MLLAADDACDGGDGLEVEAAAVTAKDCWDVGRETASICSNGSSTLTRDGEAKMGLGDVVTSVWQPCETTSIEGFPGGEELGHSDFGWGSD